MIKKLNYNDYSNPTVRSFIRDYDKTMDEAIKAKNEWNQRIRSFYRDAMGVGKLLGNSKIDIAIAPNRDLLSIIENEFPKLDLNEESALRSIIKVGNKTKEYLPDNLSENFQEIIDYSSKKLDEHDLQLLLKKMFETYNEPFTGPFGAYNCKTHSIELYLLPMVLFSNINNINFQSVFTIVLAHELAHLYNHVGEDKDGLRWVDFHKTDDHLAEGLAQYYTWELLARNEEKFYDGMSIFKLFEKHQSEPYTWFRHWKSTFEQTYFAFIEVRRNQITDHKHFYHILEETKKRIAHKETFGYK